MEAREGLDAEPEATRRHGLLDAIDVSAGLLTIAIEPFDGEIGREQQDGGG